MTDVCVSVSHGYGPPIGAMCLLPLTGLRLGRGVRWNCLWRVGELMGPPRESVPSWDPSSVHPYGVQLLTFSIRTPGPPCHGQRRALSQMALGGRPSNPQDTLSKLDTYAPCFVCYRSRSRMAGMRGSGNGARQGQNVSLESQNTGYGCLVARKSPTGTGIGVVQHHITARASTGSPGRFSFDECVK